MLLDLERPAGPDFDDVLVEDGVGKHLMMIKLRRFRRGVPRCTLNHWSSSAEKGLSDFLFCIARDAGE